MTGGQSVTAPYEVGIWGAESFKVASVNGHSQSEAEANAVLISQSKNMYEALKELIEMDGLRNSKRAGALHKAKEIFNTLQK